MNSLSMQRWSNLASKAAEKSDFDRSRLGALILNKGKIVSTGHNSHRKHGRLTRLYGFKGGCHAETAAMLRANAGDTIVVVRLLKDGNLTCSKPCERCMAMAKDFGIKKIIFSDWNGALQELKL